MIRPPLPDSWQRLLEPEAAKPYFAELLRFVDQERQTGIVYPPAAEVYAALRLTPLARVRALILGQDPYHDDGQAHGLCFSVPPGTALPPSLRNIFRELHDDLGIEPPTHGSLEPWARRGVLLLNAVLTVRAHQAGSHAGRGWERLTDRVIETVSTRRRGVVFLLWGKRAQAKRSLIDCDRHAVIEAPHPSPLSAYRGFFGSRPFSRTNRALQRAGQAPIDWRLPRSALG